MGRAILGLQKSGPIRVGAIGLGVGTLAAYARPGDVFRFYEINPQVIRMAQETLHLPCRLPRKMRHQVGRRPAVARIGAAARTST